MRYFNHLRRVRDERRLTQWEVAKGVDIPIDRYARLEKGKTEPSFHEARALGKFFGQQPVALFPVVVEHAKAS